VKAPRPGAVKTRLAAEIGDARAAAAYRALAEGVLARTAAQAGEYQRLVFFAPADARAEIATWLPGETLVAQQGDDLGARMHHAFAHAFAEGAEAIVLVGSDVPRLTRAHVTAAFDALERVPVVLGPAADGGYYLIALRSPQPGLFRGILWGSNSVRQATLQRAAPLALDVYLLEMLRDVDTAADLEAEGSGPVDPRGDAV
jgi:rSAM/selenodomain-associated transferase 1